MLLPVYGEAAFDWMVWKFKWFKGKDKPFSTWVVRPILFVVGGYFAWRLGDKEWWNVGFVMITYFGALFPLLINWILKRPIGYLSDGNWWDRLMSKIHNASRIWGSIWLMILALCVYYYYELYVNVYNAYNYLMN